LLNYGWLASLGILTAEIAGISYYFSLPRAREGEFGGVIKVGPVSEAPALNDPPVNYPEGRFWLVQTDEGLMALYKVCTHLDCLFNWDDQEGQFICPCHGSQFDGDGSYVSGPAPRSLDRFVIQIVSPEGEVLAESDLQTGVLSLSDVEKTTSSEAEQTNPTSDSGIGADAIIQVDTGRKITGGQIVG
jgi:cytochrome b6-f complex iron-sulfur subunit